MGTLVNQSHAKKLFGARLVDINYAKSYSELGNIIQYESNENGCTSNFKFLLKSYSELDGSLFEKMAMLQKKFHWEKIFKIDIFVLKYV